MDFSYMDDIGFNFQDATTLMAEPFAESQLTDDFVVNMVDGMESFDLTTIDYDHLKIKPVEMYTNLIPLENQNEMTTLSPVITSSDNLTLLAPSPSYFETSENSQFALDVTSPASPASSVGSDSPRSILSAASPYTTEESITLVVSPADVFGEQQQAPLKKKRGRKPKSESGPIRQRNQRKVKVYEINQPYEDKEQERKRLNAVNAKRHRDLQKQAKEALEQQLKDVIAERDNLKKEVETLRVKESDLTSQLEMFKNHLKSQHQSVVMLLQSTPF